MDLSSLKPNKGSTRKTKRRGRGEGSGLAVTAGRGHKGYGSRGGAKQRAWFEGGQMPLQRRLPKYGFTNISKVAFQVINVSDLEAIDSAKEITPELLYELRLVRNKRLPVKLLAMGDISKKVEIKVNAVSKSAREKVEKAGGTVTLL
jgi:large subunit ribosomal protein L15